MRCWLFVLQGPPWNHLVSVAFKSEVSPLNPKTSLELEAYYHHKTCFRHRWSRFVAIKMNNSILNLLFFCINFYPEMLKKAGRRSPLRFKVHWFIISSSHTAVAWIFFLGYHPVYFQQSRNVPQIFIRLFPFRQKFKIFLLSLFSILYREKRFD